MDKKGVIYDVASWTDKGLRKGGVIRASPLSRVPQSMLLKLEQVFKVKRTTKTGSKGRWKTLWDKYVKPARRRARARRRRVEAMPMRICPVCADEPEAVHFKLGTPVWKGKKLRVCTKRCARKVRAEVRIAIEYGVTKEDAQRKAAYKFMKKGGQL